MAIFVESPGRLCVSVYDNYCYKFQMHPRIFNPILYSKHLFQQFAVDTYIKIEISRLDYIHNHHKEIRADLTKNWWIACIRVKEEQKLLESGQ
jgi:hypothetical protein